MIRYRLACEAGHEFEGWFKSGAAYDEQAASNNKLAASAAGVAPVPESDKSRLPRPRACTFPVPGVSTRARSKPLNDPRPSNVITFPLPTRASPESFPPA